MTAQQISAVCRACAERCAAGNSWPPDLAEFIELLARCDGGNLGVTVQDVLQEYWRWRKNSWRDEFKWHKDVLYHICITMHREGVRRNMTNAELEKFAALELRRWEKKVASGYSIPKVRAQLEGPKRAEGPTPAQLLLERSKTVRKV